ncbi:hypothetical protein tb265_40450 [Gemmatimonadetes bacterium T265]|nr:hypothetical protein tb265_40450 [Gemmatimonadetes bacterium T265]
MSAADVEYFRQFAAVASLLGGFSFAFFGTLLAVPHTHRVVGAAGALALAASACFLVVTVGNTFAAAALANPALLRTRPGMLPAVLAHVGPLSGLFLLGVALLLVSFGAAGWARSQRLGLATALTAALGGAGVFWALGPFLLRTPR